MLSQLLLLYVLNKQDTWVDFVTFGQSQTSSFTPFRVFMLN